ncbi:MAG: flippase [Methylocella sp.]
MHGIKVNFVFNLAGAVVPLSVALVTIPLFVSHIGAARYGVLSIVWVLLGYFGFLDLGQSRACANELAKLGHSLRAERSKVLITSLFINVCLGVLGGLILYLAGTLLIEYLIAVPADLKPEISTAMPWIACLLPLALVSGVAAGALEASERFLTVNVMQVAGSTIGQVLPLLCAVFISPSLSFVIPAAALARGLSVLLILGFVLREERPITLRSLDWKRAKGLLSYGGWVSVTNIISPILTSLDQLVIGSLLGVVAVTHYAIPMNLVTRSQIVAFALARTLFPRMSRLANDAATGLAESAVVSLAYGYGALCAPAVVLVRPFIAWWMGEDFASIAGPVAELLLIGAWINGLGFIPYALLQGQGRPDIVAKFHVLQLIPFVFLLWYLTSRLGLIGAALAWVLRVTIDPVCLFALARFRAMQLLRIIPPLVFLLAAYIIVSNSPMSLIYALNIAVNLTVGVASSGMLFDRRARGYYLSFRLPKLSRQVR